MIETIEGRRSVLRRLGTMAMWGLAGGAVSLLAQPALAAAEQSIPLRLSNPHTDEHYDVELFVNGQWNSNALIVCDYMMRDWRQKASVTCDRKLYAALYVLQRYFAPTQRIRINSGYRTQATNQLLREQGNGAAPNSMHLKAKAVDFAMQGVDLHAIAKAVEALNLGGVGRYSTFVHMDSRGTPARWFG